MAFMRKNINVFLMTLVFLLVGAAVGITVFYESSYARISKEYVGKVTELENVANDLRFHRSQLNQTMQQVEVETEARKEYDKLYANLKLDKAAVDSALNKTEAVLANTRRELDTTRSDLLLKISAVEKLTLNMRQLNNTLGNYKTEVHKLERNTASLRSVVNELLNLTDDDITRSSINSVASELRDIEVNVKSLKRLE